MKTILEAKALIKAGKLSHQQLMRECLDRIERYNGTLHAFIEVFDDLEAQAEKYDDMLAAGKELPPLAGIPIAIKDNILIQGQIASAGSKILENYRAAYDATVIQRLRDAGAIFVGRTNCDEFAMGSSTENSAYGPSKNPWGEDLVPGGSSGGSAVAVASGMCLAALGSDTGGSIRQPASLCGIVGLKPTYGRISRYGLIALASSLDQIGPFTQSVEDTALLLEILQGDDPRDATSAAGKEITIPELMGGDVKGLKIGLPKEYFAHGLDHEIKERVMNAVQVLKEQGAEIVEVSLPHTEYALAAYYLVMPSEASSNLARFDGIRYGLSEAGKNLDELYKKTRGQGFGAETKRRIMLGTYALSSGYYDAFYKKALQVRAKIRQDFDDAFDEVDCILTPTSPTVAWKIGEKVDDPLTMYLSDIYTISVNLAALPGISIPCGL
ncbi:MAG: Asp-tRNA(Asn)/Glu-tRNA(Gln) amidotransferase subunit GatA, partial [Candidatus Uhrbacteria bacterium]